MSFGLMASSFGCFSAQPHLNHAFHDHMHQLLLPHARTSLHVGEARSRPARHECAASGHRHEARGSRKRADWLEIDGCFERVESAGAAGEELGLEKETNGGREKEKIRENG